MKASVKELDGKELASSPQCVLKKYNIHTLEKNNSQCWQVWEELLFSAVAGSPYFHIRE